MTTEDETIVERATEVERPANRGMAQRSDRGSDRHGLTKIAAAVVLLALVVVWLDLDWPEWAVALA
jgi:hypothetical protein